MPTAKVPPLAHRAVASLIFDGEQRDGDRINAVLAAAGYNFSLLLRWFEELLRVLSLILCHALLAVHGRLKQRLRHHTGVVDHHIRTPV